MSKYSVLHLNAVHSPTPVNIWLDKKQDQVDAAEGKRGVIALREKLEILVGTHRRHTLNLHDQDLREPRSHDHAEHVRKMISDAKWHRDIYGALIAPRLPASTLKHPDLQEFHEAAHILQCAKAADLLPSEYQDWDSKGRGDGVSVDLYAYVPDLVLVQVRRVERRFKKYHLSMTKSYHVTDGERVVEVSKAKIRKAAQDVSADTPLRAVKSELPIEWQDLIGEPFKLQAPTKAEMTVYKLLIERDGKLLSIHDSTVVYPIGKWLRQKARPNHRGGFYAFETQDEAEQVKDWRMTKNELRFGGVIVMVKCTARGGWVRYSNGKIAFSEIRADEILREINTMPF
jgi:hypothetical protein